MYLQAFDLETYKDAVNVERSLATTKSSHPSGCAAKL